MSLDFIYDTPNPVVLFLFILIFLSLALIGLFIFTLFTENGFDKKTNDANTSIYISAVATALALILAFIITSEYQTYNTTSLNLAREANAIYTLVEILTPFNTPESNDAISLAILYLCSIINIEFLLMQDGILPPPNPCLDRLQSTILALTPTTDKEIVLYDKAIDQLNLAINLRNYRLEQTISSLPPEFWWLLIIGISILIVLTWFVNGNLLYRIIMTSFITIIYSTLIFLTFILDLPFRSNFGLDSSVFQLALSELGYNTCPTGDCTMIQSPESNIPNSLKNKVANCVKSSKNINFT